ncbi:WhiB family transcriptional regulator [Streptomyces sp. NPDC058812]|uniref:WhiB family transcriptional regulator n=1 Tax=unclassified Streptomyces TaxID=2593676 RepID=UPI0036D14B48
MTHHTGAVPETKRKKDWRDQAACRGADSDAWFPNPTNMVGVQAAKTGCFACPVMLDCAQYALRTRQETGVWGGLSEGQRTTLYKRHRTADFDNPPLVRDVVYRALHQELNPILSLRDVWDSRSYQLPGGHIGWRGESKNIAFHGVTYTPKQVAFLVDRGHKPVGIVRRLPECPVVECVNPRHIADNEERYLRKQAEEQAAAQAAALDAAAEELAS